MRSAFILKIMKKISRFEFAIMQVADPKEAKNYQPYSEDEEIQRREKNILETAKLIINKTNENERIKRILKKRS